jgi:dTDP-4-dehydrorhamnose reductase
MLELWGGHECTVNRVGDVYSDQTERAGHQERPEDLDLFSGLGLKAIRYPVLWERAVVSVEAQPDWSWSDARLDRLRGLGLRPIIGLLHHGSGPPGTDLLDPDFPRLFARYARSVAQRYPWVGDWTPINEPLTTARFSALYGLWHPHLRDEAAFWTALINQIEAIGRAMREIRAVSPGARLIQTEDLGRTYGPSGVSRQVEFDNARRWMTWDLLCGRVDASHVMHDRLQKMGFARRLAELANSPCPPDVLGVNHYLTSDRYLDPAVEAYEPAVVGGNGEIAYADVAAVRVVCPAPGGLQGALEEVWARYRRPLAITESHNGCTREEQVRWVREAWQTAQGLRARGVDIRAVTAWALLGSYDWPSLLTGATDVYEPGAFDVRGGAPRATAVAAELVRLSGAGGPAHPATAGPGWWRRDIRLHALSAPGSVGAAAPRRAGNPAAAAPLLITGATGTLGRALARSCELRGIAYQLTSRQDLDLHDAAAMARRLEAARPWGVINAAGWVRVDAAEGDREACHAANAAGAIDLARACARLGARYVAFSSDLVFDGTKGAPYIERDLPKPCNAYGASKAVAEQGVMAACGEALVIRTAAFFSADDVFNFARGVDSALRAGSVFRTADDLIVSPTYVPHLVEAVLDLAIDHDQGLRHLTNGDAVSWTEFAVRLARALDLDERRIEGVPHAAFGWAASRPRAVPLDSERGRLLPALDTAIAQFAAATRT